MSIVDAIQSLRACTDRLDAERCVAVAEVQGALQAAAACVEASSQEASSLGEMAQLCASGAEILAALDGDPQLVSHGEALRRHLGALIGYAEALHEAQRDGAAAAPQAPASLQVVLQGAQQQRAEAVGVFVDSARTVVSELEEDLLSLESSAEPPGDALDAVRRTVHTLKAEFGALGISDAQSLCHLAESAIEVVDAQDDGSSAPVDLLLKLCDHVRRYVDELAGDVHAEFAAPQALVAQLTARSASPAPAACDARVEQQVDGDFADSLPEFIGEARAHLAEAEVAMVELAREPADVERLNLTFRAFHTIKGVAGFLNLTAIVELAHVAETLLDAGREGRFRFDGADIDLVLAAGDMIQQLIAALEGEQAPLRSEWTRLRQQLQARAERSGDAGEVAADAAAGVAAAGVADAGAADAAAEEERPVAAAAQPEPPLRAADDGGPVVQPQRPSGATRARVERTVKVSTARLDALVDMVGELVIAQSMVLQDPAIEALDGQVLNRNIAQVGKITRDLQESAMSLRMVTVKSTFQKMARLVRDAASKSGKRVELTIQGEDTELDRNVVEQIADPLVHMLRNAVDHGIEAPPERVEAGKREEGRLTLRAYHQGGSIVIEIQDDGRGIDRDKVFAKARDRGLIAADAEPTSLSDAEVFQMIFLPGFSTAEAVTDLSGRGVGMDVVRRNIEALRGKIEIESALGRGTTFHLRLPLTLAIIDGMIVRVGSGRYVLPTLSIEHSFRPRAEDVHLIAGRGECVRARGEVLPVLRLRELFAQRDGHEALEDGILIVVEVDGRRSSLFVDEIVGQQQVVIKSLGMPRAQVAGLSGGAIMTDGRVALILDVGALVDAAPAA